MLDGDQTRLASRIVINIALVGFVQKPYKLLEGPLPSRGYLGFRNIVAAFYHPNCNAPGLQFDRPQNHIDHSDFKTCGMCQSYQSSIFCRRQYCFNAYRLIGFYRRFKPEFDTLDGSKIGVITDKIFLLDDLDGQQIGIDNPDRASPTLNI